MTIGKPLTAGWIAVLIGQSWWCVRADNDNARGDQLRTCELEERVRKVGR